eukprot:g4841.t1
MGRYNPARNDITEGAKLGSGAFGEVNQGTLQVGKAQLPIAVKHVLQSKATDAQRKETIVECRLQCELTSPFVVKCFGFANYPGPGDFSILLELMDLGDLLSYMVKRTKANDRISEATRLQWMIETAAALEYVHACGLIHADIAARNLCLVHAHDRIVCKLTDFGLSKRLDPDEKCYWLPRGHAVPLWWTAPECLPVRDNFTSPPSSSTSQHQALRLTTANDVWSFGVTMWEIEAHATMSTIQRPFKDIKSGPGALTKLYDELMTKQKNVPGLVDLAHFKDNEDSDWPVEVADDCNPDAFVWMSSYQTSKGFQRGRRLRQNQITAQMKDAGRSRTENYVRLSALYAGDGSLYTSGDKFLAAAEGKRYCGIVPKSCLRGATSCNSQLRLRARVAELEREIGGEQQQDLASGTTGNLGKQQTCAESASVQESHHYCIVGAGPAGLQLGALLQAASRDYIIFEAAGSAGTFFGKFPRHRRLISINKPNTGRGNPTFNERHDWNSLLPAGNATLKFTSFSDEYWPAADAMVDYLQEYAADASLRIAYHTKVTTISRAASTDKSKPERDFLVST